MTVDVLPRLDALSACALRPSEDEKDWQNGHAGKPVGADCKSWAIPESAARWCAFCPTTRFLPRTHRFNSDTVRPPPARAGLPEQGPARLSLPTSAPRTDQRETRVLLRGRHRRLCQIPQHATKTPLHDEPILLEGRKDDAGLRRGHPVYRRLYGDHVLLRQQHSHRRGRHARDGLPQARRHQGVQRLCAPDRRAQGKGREPRRRGLPRGH